MASQPFQKINFEAEIIREHSYTPNPDELGKAKCSMELFIHDITDNKLPRNGTGYIEWYIEYLDDKGNLNGDDDVQGIGVWFENKTLTDYDQIFSLPKQAIQLLRKVGIRVPREFEN